MVVKRRRWVAGALGLAGVAVGAMVLLAEQGPVVPDFDRRAFMRAHRLPNTVLVDHEGRTARFYNDLVKGRKVVINFMYASCSNVCELSSQVMARLQAEIAARGEDIALYSISVDPERDSPQNLAEYQAQFTREAGWT